jgi:hypothetical protein
MGGGGDEAARQLEILGSICQNDKLCTQKGVIDVYRPSSYRGLQRWWTGENRHVNLACVKRIVDHNVDAIKLLLERQRSAAHWAMPHGAETPLDFMDLHGTRQATQTRIDRLRQAGRGLTNLLETYKDDCATIAELRLITQQIDDFVAGTAALQQSPIMTSSSSSSPSSPPSSPFRLSTPEGGDARPPP